MQLSKNKAVFPSAYNPATQSDYEIESNFVVRLKEFNELFQAVKDDSMKKPPPHYLIIGQRGYGKTTLLLRLKIEIEKDKELRGRFMPLMFCEDQYNIRSLAGFWEEVIQGLEDQDPSFHEFSKRIDALYSYDDNPHDKIYSLLSGALTERNKKLLLLLDNFGDIINKLSREENRNLRKILTTSNLIKIIGTSPAEFEFYCDEEEPFFDFFKVIHLDELNRDEIIVLLTNLGGVYNGNEVNKVITGQPERIDALRKITRGIPRSMALLFEIFMDGIDGNTFRDLKIILDRVTPFYKQRLDNLPTQQQAIMDAIARSWDGVGTKEISEKVRMPSKAVSSQLNQMEKTQLIKKVPTSTKNHLYQINERFFNIYYLMRQGRVKNRNRVFWLVKFFEICYGEQGLFERMQQHIKTIQERMLYEKNAFFVSQVLSGNEIPFELQQGNYLIARQSEIIKGFDQLRIEIINEAIRDMKGRDFKTARNKLKNAGLSLSTATYLTACFLEVENYLQAAMECYLDALGYGNTRAMFNLGLLYHTRFKDFVSAEKYYLMSVKEGDVGAMNNLAVLYENEFKDFAKAEKYYLMAVEKGNTGAMNNLAVLYHTQFKDFAKAEKYYLMAVEKDVAGAALNLAMLYEAHLKDFVKAEKYYKIAAEKGNIDSMNNLAVLYHTQIKDFVRAEKYYLMAVKEGYIDAMNNLAGLYLLLKKNKNEALQLLNRAYENEKNICSALMYIAVLLWNDSVEGAIKIYMEFFNSEEMQKEVNLNITYVLLMFIAKKEYSFVYRLFTENQYDVRDKYKPVYYALIYMMGEKYSDESKKMGDELKESVEDVLKAIEDIDKIFT